VKSSMQMAVEAGLEIGRILHKRDFLSVDKEVQPGEVVIGNLPDELRAMYTWVERTKKKFTLISGELN
jgi:hypothetical protein